MKPILIIYTIIEPCNSSIVSSINNEKIEAGAQKKTKSLVRALELTDDQQKQVYELLASTEKKMQSAKVSPDAGQDDMRAKKTKMQEYVNMKMKEILNEEQFNKYLELAGSL